LSSALGGGAPAVTGGGGRASSRPPEGERFSGGGGSLFGDPERFGLWLFLGTISMLFAGFTSAFILRRASTDWQPLAAPPILWINTLVLFSSSVALERARRRLVDWDLTGTQLWVSVTGVLGLLFVGGQWMAWQALAAAGVFLASNPHSSFFYVLTGVHVVHVLGGLIWFLAVLRRTRRMGFTPGEDGLRLFATYWHFLAVLWAYLLFLLFVY